MSDATTIASSDQPPARARMTGDERRGVLLAAARREFARHGYQGANIATIARSAECSEPMLYKHFAGKQALFSAVLEHATNEVEGRFDDLFSAPGSLLDNWRSFVPDLMHDPAYVEVMQLRKLAVSIIDEPGVRDALNGIQSRHEERVRVGLERGVAEGSVRADVDADYVSWMWAGIVLAGCYRESIAPGGFASMLPHAEAFIEGLRPTR